MNGEGYYTGYLSTMNRHGSSDVIRVYVDGPLLTMFTDSGTYRSLVRFIKLSTPEARQFEAAYNDCSGNAYCKGKNSPNQERRQAKRDRNNGSKFNSEIYDQCIEEGRSPKECKQVATQG